ncbi:metal-sensitive transcriptional regulator [Dehalobacter sp. DCM]|uniref:metal-sensitive transcriptional regulator n=1 Tax=Dehalobacter sp. DCM TaxID=2907827 RepID=UPI003081543A|nr:metal-sensitive transcriptional regulator [Dehalobacter sp. DCM]
MGTRLAVETVNKADRKNDIQNRLKRIEGQIKGLQRMIDEGKGCSDILIQVSAVKAAVNRVGILIFEEHSRGCLMDALGREDDGALDTLIDLMNRFLGSNISTGKIERD